MEKKEIVVKANGRVQSENIQIVVPLVSSKVKSVNFREGDYVNVGDLIIELDGSEIEINLLNYTNALSNYQSNLLLEELYLKSVKNDENLFDLEDIKQIDKYYEMDAYLFEYDKSEDRVRLKKSKNCNSNK